MGSLLSRTTRFFILNDRYLSGHSYKPGVGLVVRVVAWDPRVLSSSPVGCWIKIHQEVDSACHPSEVGKMSTSVLVRGTLHQWHSHVPTNDATSSPRLHSIEGIPDEILENEGYHRGCYQRFTLNLHWLTASKPSHDPEAPGQSTSQEGRVKCKKAS